MADFAEWVVAAEPALPWEKGAFLKAYERNRREALPITLEHEQLARQLERLLESDGDWTGTPTALFNKLCARFGNYDRSIPKNISEMSKRLRRLAPALREIGIELTWHRDTNRHRTREIAVRRVRPVRNHTSFFGQSQEDAESEWEDFA